MATVEINAGDTVYLKSGSDKMTVKFVERGEATCIWRAKGNDNEGTYPVAMLTKINPNQSEPPFMSNPRI